MKIIAMLCIAIATSILGVGCAHTETQSPKMNVHLGTILPNYEWFEAPGQATAIAVVIHGLNTNPRKMHDIIDLLNRLDICVLRVALSGHRGDMEEFKLVTRNIWLTDVREAYVAARKVADEKQLPLFFIGYSLGALINADLMSSSEPGAVRYDKMVLLAPALATRWYTRMVLTLGAMGRGYVAQSGSPYAYRANPGTPMAAYSALFESKAALREAHFRNLNIPTLVLLDPSDELISPSSLQNAVRRFGLSNWKVEFIDNSQTTVRPYYHHLILDEDAVGQEEWQKVEALIRAHLQ